MPQRSLPKALPAVQSDRDPIYFLSDVHLGGSEPTDEAVKQTRLLALLERVVSEGAALFLLGDLFDFWFEYRHVIPKTAFGILARLETLSRSGVPVFYLGGNHDAWMTGFLARDTGIQVLADETRLQAQGRTSALVHGDGLGPGDHGYKALKKVVRNPLAVRMFRWIHPDWGIGLAHWLSHAGRSSRSEDDREVDVHAKVDEEALFAGVARPLLAAGVDSVLMGHHHKPVQLRHAEGEMLILGNWFRDYTCVRLTGGVFELLQWTSTDDQQCIFSKLTNA